ncbi:hypothetical protein KI387_004210, partial [Taxus chinensis]
LILVEEIPMAAPARLKGKAKIDPTILNRMKSKSCAAVMEEIEKAITAVEYAQASHHLKGVVYSFDAEEADRAY